MAFQRRHRGNRTLNHRINFHFRSRFWDRCLETDRDCLCLAHAAKKKHELSNPIHFNRAALVTKQSEIYTRSFFWQTRRKKALSEAAGSAHFTRAARPHTHPSHFHSASARESATALARTHARSTRTRSRPAEAFSRQTEDLIGRLVSTRALRDVRLHVGLRARRRG